VFIATASILKNNPAISEHEGLKTGLPGEILLHL
jgi:hypothetical protein